MAASQTGSFNLSFTTAAGLVRTLLLNPTTFTLVGTNYLQYIQTIPTTSGGTALNVSGLTTPRWIAIINRDATNYVELLSAVSGTVIARLLPGEFACFPLDPSVTAPAMLAHTASVEVEVLVIEN